MPQREFVGKCDKLHIACTEYSMLPIFLTVGKCYLSLYSTRMLNKFGIARLRTVRRAWLSWFFYPIVNPRSSFKANELGRFVYMLQFIFYFILIFVMPPSQFSTSLRCILVECSIQYLVFFPLQSTPPMLLGFCNCSLVIFQIDLSLNATEIRWNGC